MLEHTISNQKSIVHVPSGEEIKKWHDDLCFLEITGPMLKDAVQVAETGDAVRKE